MRSTAQCRPAGGILPVKTEFVAGLLYRFKKTKLIFSFFPIFIRITSEACFAVYNDCRIIGYFFNVPEVSSRLTAPTRYFRKPGLTGPKGEKQ